MWRKKEHHTVAIATINRFIRLFHESFQALSAPVAMVDVERLAMLVHHSMDAKKRTYHTAGHVFALCEGMNPRQVLAALFHDVVYYQLDGGFPLQAGPWLEGVTRTENQALVLQAIKPDDVALQLCIEIFGFKAGQVLPLYGGMNEFLSAVVAARLLHRHLTMADLIAVVACIEATIPFRAPAEPGGTAAQVLAQRVRAQSLVQLPELLPARSLESLQDRMATHVSTAVKEAVLLANRDVGGFAEPDPGRFLSSTWLLIDESNAPLAAVGVYSLQEYRAALMRMDTFLAGLNPQHIFQDFDGLPDTATLTSLRATAQRNIKFACNFLDAKITSIAVIEALALCTGTDCPISMFLGDVRSAYGKPDRVEDFLPAAPSGQALNAELLKVLEKGRALESANDLTASPLTAFVYRHLGQEGIREALHRARQMFDGSLPALGFLQTLNGDMVRAIIRACSQIALSRKNELLALERTLANQHCQA
jgi:hypothetical protein